MVIPYKESLQLVEAIVKEELDYIHLSLWGGYDSKPEGADQSFGSLFKAVLDDETKLIIVGNIFSEEAARDAVENYTDIIAVGRGTLVDPEFGHKIMNGKGDTIVHEVTPEHVPNMHLTPGLFEASHVLIPWACHHYLVQNPSTTNIEAPMITIH